MTRILAAAFAAFAFGVALLGAPAAARAEGADVSTMQLDVELDGVDVTAEIPSAALDRARAGREISAYLRDHVHLAYSSDGLVWPMRVGQLSRGRMDGEPSVVAVLHFVRPDGLRENALELTDDALAESSASHRVVVFVRRDFEMGKLDGAPKLAGVLQASRQALTLLRADAGWYRGMRALLALGIDRLMVGPGLLLLWLLLLTPPLVAMHGRWSGVRTTRGAVRALGFSALAFTAGHAVSFAGVAIGHVQLPLPPLELMVAASLALVAFHTVRPLGRLSGTWISALGGLVHGLAFAASLADVGPVIGAVSLVMFIAGVEGLQLLLVGLVAPSLVFLRDARVYGVIRAGAALAAALAALVTVAPTPVVLLVAVAVLALTSLAAATLGQRVFHSAPAR